MMIVKKMLDPSREDAVRLTRTEKMSMLHLMYAVTILEDLSIEIPDRIGMVENGHDKLQELARNADKLLNEIRITVPENQRRSIQNTAQDYEMRLTPKATPGETSVVMTKDEFRELVECARTKCTECTYDDEECEQCSLFRLLTSILPMEDYHSLNLCVYNLGKWKN